jgi:hypothetical protein
MARGNQTTLTAVTAPTVLTIGCPPTMQALAARCMGSMKVLLKHCDLAQAPTIAARFRPLAIVIPEDLYEFDPQEFDALARDVGASVLRVEDDIEPAMFETLLGTAVDAAMTRRRKQGARMVDINDPRARAHALRPAVPRVLAPTDLDTPPSSQGVPRA